MQACRSMIHGILKLLGAPPAIEKQVKWLTPLKMKGDKRQQEEEMKGTLPHRAVALASEANAEELTLKLYWEGPGHVRLVCMLYSRDGTLLHTVWEGDKRRPGIQYCSRDPDFEEADDEEVSYVLVGDIVHLRLNQLPSDTFAVAIAVVATENGAPWASQQTMSNWKEMAISLCFKQQCLWKYRQANPGHRDEHELNVCCTCCIYRGPNNTWRMEPMNLPLMMMHLDKVEVPPTVAASEIARVMTVKLAWMIQDRCWTTCKEERGLQVAD